MASIIGTALGSGITEVVNAVGDQVNRKTELQADITKLAITSETQVQVAQTEINKVEAGNISLFVSGWRPAAGWACVGGLVYQIMFRPILGWIMANLCAWSIPPALEIDTLMTLLFGLLGLGGYRTFEKTKGLSK